MLNLYETLTALDVAAEIEKATIVDRITREIRQAGYTLAEIDDSRPWGAFFRAEDNEANRFLGEFFLGTSPVDARLGNPDAALSPKILMVESGKRLSLQRHDRRAERWHFLTSGRYIKGTTLENIQEYEASPGDVVQFEARDIHRLIGHAAHYTLVAEVWQHTYPDKPSNEDDITRLDDDYQR